MASDEERNALIKRCLDEGMSLSQVQDQLVQQLGIHMTYMELRMLTSEMSVNWAKQDEKAAAARPKMPQAKAASKAPATAPMPDDAADDALPPEENPEEDAEEDAAEMMPPEDEEDGAGAGGTTVEVSKLVRPGAQISGTVKFGSGASGEWYIDGMGRLGFLPDEGSAKPTPKDIREFQMELQKKLGGY